MSKKLLGNYKLSLIYTLFISFQLFLLYIYLYDFNLFVFIKSKSVISIAYSFDIKQLIRKVEHSITYELTDT